MATAGSRLVALHRSALALVVVVAAGCSGRQDAFVNVKVPGGGATVSDRLGNSASVPDIPGLMAAASRKPGHPYFPIRPGAYWDYRVTRLGVGVRYVRVSTGLPEPFFGHTPTPFVFGDVPGEVRDSTLFGLRQYYSYSPGGDVWFHGAQNNGFMSHTEPPVRQLLARPMPGDAWADTVLFESFLPGMEPFVQAVYTYSWTLSEPWRLVLTGGVFHAVRSSSVIDELPMAIARPSARPASTQPGPASRAWQEFVGFGVPPLPEPVRGAWYSRHDGMVARDWPSGQGEVNLNAVTFELIGRGTGPVPPPAPLPGTF